MRGADLGRTLSQAGFELGVVLPRDGELHPAAFVRGGARAAIERAFHRFYDDLGRELAGLIKSKEAPQRRLGQELIRVEYENLMTAVRLALADRGRFYEAFEAIFRLLIGQSAHRQAADLCRLVLNGQEGYPQEAIEGDIGRHFYLVFDRLAYSNLNLKQYDEAQKAYERGLALIGRLISSSAEWRGKAKASTYHQLGRVAEEQRRWEEAESHYRQALGLYVEFNDRYSQANTYGQLGLMAETREQWPQAADVLLQALAIFVDFGDQHNLAQVIRILARVYQASGDGTIVGRVAGLLGVSADEAARLLGL